MAHFEMEVGCFSSLFCGLQRKRDTTSHISDASESHAPSTSDRKARRVPEEIRPQEIVPGDVPKVNAEILAGPSQHADSEPPAYTHLNNCVYCDIGDNNTYRPASDKPPAYTAPPADELYRPEVLTTIEESLEQLAPALRKLSLDISTHPELGFEERFAHDLLTNFMAKHGFAVTPHYRGLSTAWRAAYTHVPKRERAADDSSERPHRVIGVNAEMDALPGIGHGCGHNLIAMAGVGTAVAIKAALQAHDVQGTVVLLGTPAEEGGGGKQILLDNGAYDEMDACIMCHPTDGPDNSTWVAPSLASQPIDVEFFGHGSHASSAPWNARNALDAAFLAYSSVSVLRQQILPSHRVHGIVTGRDWSPNVIPDYAKMRWIVRAPSWSELNVLRGRVMKCFEAAAHATACELKVRTGIGYYDVRENDVLGQEYIDVTQGRWGMSAWPSGEMRASTDFGNVSYALPAIHPLFSIPTEPNGSNHTAEFAESARQPEAHDAALKVSKGLAAVGFRFLDDERFARAVDDAFEDELRASGKAKPEM
ncbi:hypothetical protein CERSUDRAFT_112965 [Gelatoporia subvermispora B]|uniref:Peptidase M20 dimerisation domain-containing protein n=1 Tax=Ceriporiopsis subvermispora (strain B) TaxID=914234 RepID=M2RKG2_CERS8|nr:hypothetical protein CERSUDRAFT_112965 [Gelatoporia subvermispora B]